MQKTIAERFAKSGNTAVSFLTGSISWAVISLFFYTLYKRDLSELKKAKVGGLDGSVCQLLLATTVFPLILVSTTAVSWPLFLVLLILIESSAVRFRSQLRVVSLALLAVGAVLFFVAPDLAIHFVFAGLWIRLVRRAMDDAQASAPTELLNAVGECATPTLLGIRVRIVELFAPFTTTFIRFVLGLDEYVHQLVILVEATTTNITGRIEQVTNASCPEFLRSRILSMNRWRVNVPSPFAATDARSASALLRAFFAPRLTLSV